MADMSPIWQWATVFFIVVSVGPFEKTHLYSMLVADKSFKKAASILLTVLNVLPKFVKSNHVDKRTVNGHVTSAFA